MGERNETIVSKQAFGFLPSLCFQLHIFTLLTSPALFPQHKKGAQKPKNLFAIIWKNSFPVPFSFFFPSPQGFAAHFVSGIPGSPFGYVFYHIFNHFIPGYEDGIFDPPILILTRSLV